MNLSSWEVSLNWLKVPELEELDSEIVNEQLSDGFNVPSYIPSKPAGAGPVVASSQPNEADQLSNMMNIWWVT